MSAAGNAYLLLYNLSLTIGWAYCLYLTYQVVILQHGGPAELWTVLEFPLKIVQTSALLEVVHSATGLVRSPLAVTAMQVASRQWVLWGLLVPLPAATTTGGIELGEVAGVKLQLSLVSLIVAWGLSEVIRYSFFAFKELGHIPYPSTWLRYTGFLVLYPVGVSSELAIAWMALPAIRQKQMWRLTMPNMLNFGFDYGMLCVVVMLTYIPGLPHLYSYMLTQRKKVLSPSARSHDGKAPAAQAAAGKAAVKRE
ncbi:MAG: hypothetical protein WDW38_009010 [Sanguina aurantia]